MKISHFGTRMFLSRSSLVQMETFNIQSSCWHLAASQYLYLCCLPFQSFFLPGIRNASIILFVAFSVRRFSSSFLFIVHRLSVYTIKYIFLKAIYPYLIHSGIGYLSGSVLFCCVKQITFLSSGFRMFSSHDHIP